MLNLRWVTGRAISAWAVLTLPSLIAAPMGLSLDVGVGLKEARALLVDRGAAGGWLRLRGLQSAPADETERAETRRELQQLRAAGFRLIAHVRWDPASWLAGVRRDRLGHRLPIDLREARERCRQLAAAYGDLVDFWEFDNEPDLTFVNENPETYAAFLKACAVGAMGDGRGARGQEASGEGREARGEEVAMGDRLGARGEKVAEARGDRPIKDGVDLGRSGPRQKAEASSSNPLDYSPSPLASNLPLMAPLGLPPGPYFEDFARNDGLRYTAGFNYHFYGYDEDFTGLYRQHEEAVATALAEQAERWPAGVDAGTAMWRSRFFPSAAGWVGESLPGFDFPAGAANIRRETLRRRERAREEPPLQGAGRWLVTEGVIVEEIPGGWRFRLEGWPPTAGGAQRAPVAELPLPAGWRLPPGSLLSFHHRVENLPGAKAASEFEPRVLPALPVLARLGPAFVAEPKAPAVVRSGPADWPEREFPILLTEYGYGSLSKLARWTPAGRENQRRFFLSASAQIRSLDIEGAMAFVLNPYLESDQQEFGLLADESDRWPASWRSWGRYRVTPAMEELLAQAQGSFVPKRWPVRTPPMSPVVIDFVAGKGLGMAKSYGGYFLEGEHGRQLPGEGEVVVYNFAAEPVSGRLELEGEAWSLVGGGRALGLRLAPNERRVVRVEVRPTVRHFVGQPVTAWFKPGPVDEPPAAPRTVAPGQVEPAAVPPPSQAALRVPMMLMPGEPVQLFEPYFRTANGNLYEAGARLVPTREWQSWHQAAENFGPAFFGRLKAPRRFLDNEPVALVFHFHPATFPVVFEVRNVQVARYAAPR